jgi:hypothetical protein
MPCGSKLAQLLDAPVVERIAEPRAQAEAGEVEPQPLVLRRSPPPPGALHQGVEQRAQQGHLPVVALAEQMFELAAQAPDLLAVDRLRAGTEDPFDPLHGVGKARRQDRLRRLRSTRRRRRATGTRAASAVRGPRC